MDYLAGDINQKPPYTGGYNNANVPKGC